MAFKCVFVSQPVEEKSLNGELASYKVYFMYAKNNSNIEPITAQNSTMLPITGQDIYMQPITSNDTQGGEWNSVAPTKSTSLTLRLLRDRSYIITVVMENSAGINTMLPLSTIILPVWSSGNATCKITVRSPL